MPNFIKIRPVGSELFHAYGQTDGWTDEQRNRQTDTTKLTVAFRNSVNTPKKDYFQIVVIWLVTSCSHRLTSVFQKINKLKILFILPSVHNTIV